MPGDLACRVRVGGYGGAEGLAAFIDEQGFDLLVDATHPYAARISRNAVRAARLAGVPCWALRRPLAALLLPGDWPLARGLLGVAGLACLAAAVAHLAPWLMRGRLPALGPDLTLILCGALLIRHAWMQARAAAPPAHPSFGRLRPLHTNAVIFAFGGCALFATSYYVVQRTSQARLISDTLAAFTFWGWQAVIVGAVLTLPQGFTTSKEYA